MKKQLLGRSHQGPGDHVVDLSAESLALIQRFEEQWSQASKSLVAPPILDTFTKQAPEAERDAVFARLLQVEGKCREQLRAGATGESQTTKDGGSEETATIPRSRSISTDDTLDFVPGKHPQRRDVQKPARIQSLPSVPGYELIGVLGRGGMGVVYCARQIGLNRLVALKMVLAGEHAGEDRIRRFQAEAEAVASVQHPNIVQIYDVGKADGLPYFSFEFVDGPSLDKERNGKPLIPVKAAEMVETLAKAIQTAHNAGIVHRDLKPGNILLAPDNTPKITDFGLVKNLQEGHRETETGNVLGTPSYMAPEQAKQGKSVGPTADVYSLGSILYYLLTGIPPFNGPTAVDTLFQLLNDEPISPRQLQPQIPADLETICLKALDKSPSKRYASAQELADDLRRFLRGEPIRARAIGRVGRVVRWCQRNPRVAWPTMTAVSLAVLLLVSGVVFSAQLFQKKKEADSHLQIAKNRTELAISTLQSLIYEVQDILDNEKQQLVQVKKRLLEVAKKGLDEIAPDGDEYGSVSDVVAASAERKFGDSYAKLGYPLDAIRHYHRSLKLATRLHESGNLPEPEKNFSRLHRLLTDQYRETSNDEKVKYHAEQQLIYQKRMLDRYPDDRATIEESIGYTLGRLANVAKRRGDMDECIRLSTEGFALREKALQSRPSDLRARTELAGARSTLVQLHLRKKDRSGALSTARRVVRDLIAIKDDYEHEDRPMELFRLKWNIALKRRSLGDLLIFGGDAAKAMEQYQTALTSLGGMQKVIPKNLARVSNPSDTMKRHIAGLHHRVGTVLLRDGDRSKAQIHFEKSVELRRALAAGARANSRTRTQLMISLARANHAAEAVKLAESLLRPTIVKGKKRRPRNSVLIEVAAAYSMCSERASQQQAQVWLKKAQQCVQQAIVAKPNYRDDERLKKDPDLHQLRQTPGFQKLIQAIEVARADRQKKQR